MKALGWKHFFARCRLGHDCVKKVSQQLSEPLRRVQAIRVVEEQTVITVAMQGVKMSATNWNDTENMVSVNPNQRERWQKDTGQSVQRRVQL